MMFKNKHVVTAMIVTPILAIIGYFATDYIVSEQPQKAQADGQYQLAQLPNCRYESGKCELKNGNFSVVITGDAADDGVLSLKLDSAFSLDDVRISVVKDPADIVGPSSMTSVSNEGKAWEIDLQVTQPQQQYLRLVMAVDGAVYYAETQMPFLNYQTSFNKDFR